MIIEKETAKYLKKYLDIINFYKRFLPRAAETLALLNDLLHGNSKERTPVSWTLQVEQTFETSKKNLAQAVLLAHPKINAKFALFIIAFEHSIGAALQQRSDNKAGNP